MAPFVPSMAAPVAEFLRMPDDERVAPCKAAKAQGYSCEEVRAAGFTCADAKKAGYDWSECKAAEYTLSELMAAGVDIKGAQSLGYPLSEVKLTGKYTRGGDLGKGNALGRQVLAHCQMGEE